MTDNEIIPTQEASMAEIVTQGLHCAGCKDHGPFAPEPQCMGMAQPDRLTAQTTSPDAGEVGELVAREIERYGEGLVPDSRIVAVWLAAHFRSEDGRAALTNTTAGGKETSA